jgi:hypothetical protein
MVIAACVVAAGGLLACQDSITAPGACPQFCPQGEIAIVDTLLPNSTTPLGSYDGYRLPHESDQMQVVGPGGPAESRALIVFYRFGNVLSTSDTTVKDSIFRTDSIRFALNVVGRTDVAGLTLALHAIPIVTDSTATFASTAPYFADSTLIATLPLPDSLTNGQVSATVVPGALAHYLADNTQIGIGISIASPQPAFVSLATADTIPPARVIRFVQVDTSDASKLVTRADTETIYFHTFVADTAKLPAPQGLVVGGMQAARAFMQLNVPQQLLDSTLIIRATLLLPPVTATFGAPGDTIHLRVQELGADFGPKSPLVTLSTDTTRTGAVAVGSSDTVRVDITDVLRAWHTNSALPHNVMLRVIPEAGSIGWVELAPSDTSVLRGTLRITYGLPFRLPGR